MERIKILIVALLLSSLFSCKKEVKKTELKQGFWRAEIHMQDQALPFNFEVIKKGEKYKEKRRAVIA